MSTQLKSQGASLSGTDLANFPEFIPDSLVFKETKRGIAARRTPVKFRSEQQSYSTSTNRLIRVIVPNNALYDTRNGYMTFNIVLSNSNGTYIRVHQGIFSLFNRLRAISGAAEIEDLRDWNRLYSFIYEMLNPTLVASTIGNVMGIGTQAERNAFGAAASTDYACPLFSGVFSTELLPTNLLSGGLILELYLDDVVNMIETDSTTQPIVTISNIQFHMERLDVADSFMAYLNSRVRQNGLSLGFQTWERYINALAGGTNQNLQINHRSSSVNGLLHFFYDSSVFNNMAVNDKFLNWLPISAVTSSLLINGSTFPDEPVDLVTAQRIEAYHRYCRWVLKWKLSGILEIAPSISIQAFGVNRFVDIDDLEPYPNNMDIINPFSTLGNNATMNKKFTFSAPIPANYQLDTWVEYFRQVEISTNGLVRVLQ